MPHHLYCSRSFEQRFRWKATGAANAIIAQCVGAAVRSPFLEPLVVADVNGRGATLEVDPITTPRAVLVLVERNCDSWRVRASDVGCQHRRQRHPG